MATLAIKLQKGDKVRFNTNPFNTKFHFNTVGIVEEVIDDNRFLFKLNKLPNATFSGRVNWIKEVRFQK